MDHGGKERLPRVDGRICPNGELIVVKCVFRIAGEIDWLIVIV